MNRREMIAGTLAAPTRVQFSRKLPEGAVSVRSPTVWGSIFNNCWINFYGTRCTSVVNRDCELDACLAAFRAVMRHPSNVSLRNLARKELRGKNLACSCDLSRPCHADILLEIANEPDEPGAP